MSGWPHWCRSFRSTVALCMNSWMVAAFHFSPVHLYQSRWSGDIYTVYNTMFRNARIIAFPSNTISGGWQRWLRHCMKLCGSTKIMSLIKAKSVFDPVLSGSRCQTSLFVPLLFARHDFFNVFSTWKKVVFFPTSASSNHSLEPLWCWQRVSLGMSPNWTCAFHHIHDTTAKLVPRYLEDHPS